MRNIFVALGVLGIVLLFLTEAQATGACRTHHCDDDGTQQSNPSSPVIRKDNDDGQRVLGGLGSAVLVGCAGISGYQGLWNGQWHWPYEWCLGLVEDRLSKPSASHSENKVTPDNLSDKPIGVRLYQ